MFIGCCFGVKLTEKKLFLLMEILEFNCSLLGNKNVFLLTG
jgi:hypothetical protein